MPAGIFAEFPIPSLATDPAGITVGPDGNLWFTETNGNQVGNIIGRITPSGVITKFPLQRNYAVPFGISPGPDGRIWFTESAANQIGALLTPQATQAIPVLSSYIALLLATLLALAGVVFASRIRLQ